MRPSIVQSARPNLDKSCLLPACLPACLAVFRQRQQEEEGGGGTIARSCEIWGLAGNKSQCMYECMTIFDH